MKEENRIRKYLNNYTDYWWLRSSVSLDYDNVAYVNNWGHVNSHGCYYVNGVVPTFII